MLLPWLVPYYNVQQRSSFAITTLILSAVSSAEDDEGISKTKLMQQIIINLPRANSYLSKMQVKELIEYDSKTRRYKITS